MEEDGGSFFWAAVVVIATTVDECRVIHHLVIESFIYEMGGRRIIGLFVKLGRIL